MDLEVNGRTFKLDGDPERSLLGVLRDELDLTGSKYGCGEGQCGACTVLIAGAPVRSCITPLRVAAAKAITTIEGLAKNGELHPLQQAFLDADAFQCGYCTSGMIMSAAGLLSKSADPKTPEIARAMQGNVCRCGTYPKIVTAVHLAAAAMKRGRHA